MAALRCGMHRSCEEVLLATNGEASLTGRSPGSKNKLSKSYANWCEHGAAVIAKVCEERPADYLKIVASNLPRKCMSENVASRIWGDEELFSTVDLLRGAKAAYGKHQGSRLRQAGCYGFSRLIPRSAHWRKVKAAGSCR